MMLARNRNPNFVQPDPGKAMSDLVRGMLIAKAGEKTIKAFTALLNNCFREGTIDLLLRSVDRYIGHNEQAQKSKPNLILLLDLNFEEASTKFKVEYLNYHLQLHNQNRKETAEAIGMNRNTLDTKILRLKSALENGSIPKNKLNSSNS